MIFKIIEIAYFEVFFLHLNNRIGQANHSMPQMEEEKAKSE